MVHNWLLHCISGVVMSSAVSSGSVDPGAGRCARGDRGGGRSTDGDVLAISLHGETCEDGDGATGMVRRGWCDGVYSSDWREVMGQ